MARGSHVVFSGVPTPNRSTRPDVKTLHTLIHRLLPLLAAAILAACGDATSPGDRGVEVRLNAVVYADSQFVAVGAEQEVENGGVVFGTDRALVVRSVDGREWERAPLSAAGTLAAVAHGNGAFVAVGATMDVPSASQPVMLRSEDGSAWRPVEEAPRLSWRAIAFGAGRFVAVGVDPETLLSVIAASDDGAEWEAVTETDLRVTGITFAGGRFLLWGEGGGLGTSGDGREWGWIPIEPLNDVAGVAYVNGRFVGRGKFDCCFGEMPDSVRYFDLASEDGERWEATPTETRDWWHTWLYGGRNYLAVAHAGMAASADLEAWTPTRTLEASGLWRLGGAYGAGTFVAVGRHQIDHSTDGRKWSTVPVPE